MPDQPNTKTTAEQVKSTLRLHTDPLTQRSEAISSASASLALQEKKLVQDTQKLSQQAGALEKTVNQSVEQLKEMGDLQNWAEVVFRDISILEETMRMAGEEQDNREHETRDGAGE